MPRDDFKPDPRGSAGAGSLPDAEACYAALLARDSRFDGMFFAGVVSTGVFCRPVCPARKPKFENCRFHRTAAEAQAAGFRPCKRCRPETAPRSPAWSGTEATVRRALRLIDAGALNTATTAELAARLGVGERHLRRLFTTHAGVSPHQYAASQRLNLALQLLRASGVTITEAAGAAGFGSLRRFNSAFRGAFGAPPSSVRRPAAARHGGGGRAPYRLELGYRPPFDWRGLLAFHAARAAPGLERVDGDRFTRTFSVGGADGRLTARLHPAKAALVVDIETSADVDLLPIADRARALFDLDAAPARVADDLGRDRALKPLVRDLPGLRLPGGWSPYEQGVRAILGQQVTVAAARTLTGRLVAASGRPSALGGEGPARIFPDADRLAEADMTSLGMPKARAEAVRGFAAACAEHGDPRLDDGAAWLAAVAEIPGVGAWTLNYLRMRGLCDPDAFPVGDAALLNAARALGLAATMRELACAAERWRPWRSYAAIALWRFIARETAMRTEPER